MSSFPEIKKSFFGKIFGKSTIRYGNEDQASNISVFEGERNVIEEPYKYNTGLIYSIINTIALDISLCNDYRFVDSKGKEVETSQALKSGKDAEKQRTLQKILQRPSIEHPTFSQLLFELAQESCLYNNQFLKYNEKSSSLSVVRSQNLQSYCGIINNHVIDGAFVIKYQHVRQESFSFNVEYQYDEDNEYYVYKTTTGEELNEHILVPYEFVFTNRHAGKDGMTGALTHFSLHSLKNIALHVALYKLILEKNMNIVYHQSKGEILSMSLTDQDGRSVILNNEEQGALARRIDGATNGIKEGGVHTIYPRQGKLNVDRINLAEGKSFEFIFEKLLLESQQVICDAFRIPRTMKLEQAKYNNEISMLIQYYEQAFKPRLEIVFNHLNSCFHKVGLLSEDIFIEPKLDDNNIKKRVESYEIQTLKGIATLEEIRHKAGLDRMSDEELRQALMYGDIKTTENNDDF